LIPSGVARDFFPKLPTEPSALRSTQPLKMSTRKTPGGKGGRFVRVTVAEIVVQLLILETVWLDLRLRKLKKAPLYDVKACLLWRHISTHS
jgi:hypothetical protein